MTGESTDLAQAGSDNANPSTDLNDPANLDFYDPGESQDNVTPKAVGTDPESEPDEPSEEPEAQESDEDAGQNEDAETETEAESKPPVEVNLPDDAIVTLADGQKVKFSDLKEAPLFKADYTRKMQAIGNERRDLEAKTDRITKTIDTFADYLANQLPAEPSPALALQDPSEYTRQKAVYDASLAQVQALIQMGAEGKTVAQQISREQHQAQLQEANAKLLERLPTIADPKERAKFNQTTWETAQHFGFTPEELNNTTDWRLLWMGHYASIGMKAEQASKKVAQKVVNAPAVTPVKRAANPGNPQFVKNKDAMRRLAKSGSIKDAMEIDFE